MAESIRSIHRECPNYSLPSLFKKGINEPSYYVQPFDITQKILNNSYPSSDKLLLLNFAPDTDPTGLRAKLWKNVCQNQIYSFATCFYKLPGVDRNSLPSIYERNRQYPLWLSPRGNGIDCHRTWKTLYLDAIPIVWHSTLDPLYADLPIIIINDLNGIARREISSK
ncbi:unnamed protein product [Rotaria magnacalcarata]|uniref:Uncharacterized protein n=3 Tax=Rotaria magnacalcarata TaxID=392030 RepID=A0A816Z034_9BILA|nr:unnamed protein product [Rotaria magnacalcarata]CAF1686981.1 unnamed protein product [Rotaria magnacalcarata]CAF2105700.1 unnamed protein product [Rotaria magnacalcarata]CAF2119385.1 unnamed protein product [Rotaria magnacalcarata]CAF2183347.1 unnamed protein product [Rotaria magnacalcarata]